MKWGDDDVTGTFEDENVKRFRVEKGKKDLVRIITDPIRYFSHVIKHSPFYITCRREEGECPACNAGIARKQRVGCLLVHIARKEIRGGGEWIPVGLVKPWMFAKDRWYDLTDIKDENPTLKKEGAIKKVDFILTCKDPVFQDMRISLSQDKSQMTKGMLENVAEAKAKLNFYTSPMDYDKQMEALGEIKSDSPDLGDEVPKDTSIMGDDEEVPPDVTDAGAESATSDDADIDDIMAGLENEE